MKIQIHSITVRATIVHDDMQKQIKIERTQTLEGHVGEIAEEYQIEQFEQTFKHADLPKLPGLIGDIFSLAKRYLFHNPINTPQPIPPLSSRGGTKGGVQEGSS